MMAASAASSNNGTPTDANEIARITSCGEIEFHYIPKTIIPINESSICMGDEEEKDHDHNYGNVSRDTERHLMERYGEEKEVNARPLLRSSVWMFFTILANQTATSRLKKRNAAKNLLKVIQTRPLYDWLWNQSKLLPSLSFSIVQARNFKLPLFCEGGGTMSNVNSVGGRKWFLPYLLGDTFFWIPPSTYWLAPSRPRPKFINRQFRNC